MFNAPATEAAAIVAVFVRRPVKDMQYAARSGTLDAHAFRRLPLLIAGRRIGLSVEVSQPEIKPNLAVHSAASEDTQAPLHVDLCFFVAAVNDLRFGRRFSSYSSAL